MQEHAEGGDADTEQARYHYAKACVLDNAHCLRQPRRDVGKGQRAASRACPSAIELYDRGCELGGAGACIGMGNLYLSGRGVRAVPTLSRAYYGRARESRQQWACSQ